jgi:hypothetical protein
VRSIFFFAFVLAASAMVRGALADPIMECGVLAGDNIAVDDCRAPNSTSAIAP